MQAAAQALAGWGVQVTLLSDRAGGFGRADRGGMQVVALPPLPYRLEAPKPAAESYRICGWLRSAARPFDAVVFPDQGGGAYYALLARRAGLGLEHTAFLITPCEPAGRTREASQVFPCSLDHLAQDFLERQCAEMADGFLEGDAEALARMKGQGWRLSGGPVRRETLKDRAALAGLLRWRPAVAGPSQALVSVCITHRERPELLAQCVQSVLDQDYPAIEIIVVDDGSSSAEAIARLNEIEATLARRGGRVIRQPNRYPGAARNNAVWHAQGAYVVFADDDNWLCPTAVSCLTRTIERTGCDMVTAPMARFSGPSAPPPGAAPKALYVPLGPALLPGLFENLFGDTHAILRRDRFLEAGGYAEDFGVGREDWEFYARAMFRGLTLTVMPEALYWHRGGKGSLRKTMDSYGSTLLRLSPYIEAMPPGMADLPLAVEGMMRLQNEKRRLHGRGRVYQAFASLLSRRRRT
jgi:GT2 family glycosyltransferase